MSVPLSKLGIGAGQFRLEGVHAPRGRSPEAEVGEILSVAARSGLRVFDTSSSNYAEAVVGAHLPKPCRFRMMVKTGRIDRGPDSVEADARASLRRLGLQCADAIIVQVAGDLFGPQGNDVWRRLLSLRDEGLFQFVGVSAHASDDPLGVVKRFKPDIIQAPASLLDQRLLIDGTLATLAEWGVEVQLRSIFLQGLLFLEALPMKLQAAAPHLKTIKAKIAQAGSTPLAAALGFVLARPEIAYGVVGVTGVAELDEILAAARSPRPELDWAALALKDEMVLTPSLW